MDRICIGSAIHHLHSIYTLGVTEAVMYSLCIDYVLFFAMRPLCYNYTLCATGPAMHSLGIEYV